MWGLEVLVVIVRLISAPPWCDEPALLATGDNEKLCGQSDHSRDRGPPGTCAGVPLVLSAFGQAA